jgi:hypothetical protein
MNTVNDFLKIFIPTFLLFSLVGAFAGYDARPQHLLKQITQDLQVINQESIYSLVHACDINKKQYHYSVDTNKWKVTGSLFLVSSSVRSTLAIPATRFEEYHNIVVSLLGGATGGVSLQSALKKSPKTSITTHIKKTVVGIIGGISGYSFGYWLGSNYDMACDSEIFTQTINDKQNWQQMEKYKLLINMLVLENIEGAHLSVTGKTLYDWQQDPAFMCSDKLKEIKLKFDQIADIQIDDPTSQHFGLIDQMDQFHTKVAATQAYQILIKYMLTQSARLNKKIDKAPALRILAADKKAQWNKACAQVEEITI